MAWFQVWFGSISMLKVRGELTGYGRQPQGPVGPTPFCFLLVSQTKSWFIHLMCPDRSRYALGEVLTPSGRIRFGCGILTFLFFVSIYYFFTLHASLRVPLLIHMQPLISGGFICTLGVLWIRLDFENIFAFFSFVLQTDVESLSLCTYCKWGYISISPLPVEVLTVWPGSGGLQDD